MTTFSPFAARLARPTLALLGLGFGLAGCQTDVDMPMAASAGNASFQRYLAVGNSLTAGYADNGLYLEGQQNSYPSILAQQFALAGGGQFRQPLFSDAQAAGSGYLTLTGFSATGAPITQTVPGTGGRGTSPAAAPYTKYLSAVENLGVPGIRLSDIQTLDFGNLNVLRPGGINATNFNPYFERITPDGSSQSYFQRVKSEIGTPAIAANGNNPAVPAVPSANGNTTFFSCWLGNNDVLSYATSGGALAALSPAQYGITPFAAPADTFNRKAVRIINALTANGAKGVVSSIPDVAGIPFFTTVGPSARASFAAANVPSAAPFVYTTGSIGPGAPNTKVAATLGDIKNAAGGTLLLTLTAAPYIGLYGQATGKYYRDFYNQLKPGLPAAFTLAVFLSPLGINVDTTKAFGQSTQNPFPSTLVLDATEQKTVLDATTSYNTSLQNAALAKGLAFFDANQFFRNIAANGVTTNGINNTANFITGNLFSLDGVHPTPRGYALVANEIIRVINARYGASVPPVNPNAYRGILLPK